MKPHFKLSAFSLAILIVGAPAVNAATKHTVAVSQKAGASQSSGASKANATPWYSTNTPYPMTFGGTVPTSNAWLWSPAAPVLPTNYDQFMVWAEDLNAVKSHEPLLNCWNNMLCVGGLMDVDLLLFNHVAYPFGSAGATAGTGVRPTFGKSVSGNAGSSTVNFLVDFKFADMARFHADIAYINASTKADAYAWNYNLDIASGYTQAAGIKMNEVYMVLSTPHSYPLYVKMGKFYDDFGQYQPDGFGLPTITPSLTQLMTQVRTSGGQVGLALENGLYGSGTWAVGNQSLMPLLSDISLRHASKNYSARVGMMRQMDNAYFNVNASYIWDIRDADYFVGSLNTLNQYLVGALAGNFFGPFTMRRQHAYAIHGDGKYYQWGGGVEAAATTGPLNWDGNSNLWTAGANVNYSFPTLGHDSSFDLSYQVARHSAFIHGTGTSTVYPFVGYVLGPLSNELPKNRIQLTYEAKIVKHINAAVQLVHDRDFAPPAGTNLAADYFVMRFDFAV